MCNLLFEWKNIYQNTIVFVNGEQCMTLINSYMFVIEALKASTCILGLCVYCLLVKLFLLFFLNFQNGSTMEIRISIGTFLIFMIYLI